MKALIIVGVGSRAYLSSLCKGPGLELVRNLKWRDEVNRFSPFALYSLPAFLHKVSEIILITL